MIRYPKIPAPFYRHTEAPLRGKLDEDHPISPEFEALMNVPGWRWTEKLDGTPVRIYWDGYRPTFGGRTENSEIPKELHDWLTDHVTEELLEQKFGGVEVMLFGEGVGPKIQQGTAYGDTRVILFDALALYVGSENGIWLHLNGTNGIAGDLGMESAPVMLPEHTTPAEVIAAYSSGDAYNSITAMLATNTAIEAEGVVGTAPHGLLDRRGERIQVKIKRKDFR